MRDVPGGARLAVRCQPRAAANEIAGLAGRALKVRITAPPVEGAANDACAALLAAALGVPRRQVRVVSGARRRDKVVEVQGRTAAEVAQRLAPLTRGAGEQ